MGCFVKKMLLAAMTLSVMTTFCYANDMTEDYYDIAQNYYREGNKQKAMEYINQILDIEKDNLDALSLKFKLNPPTFSKKFPDIDKPLIFDVPYVSSGNAESDTYFQNGFKSYKSRDYADAEESLKTAVKICPNNFRAYNTLGLVYWAENKLDEAKTSFLKSNEMNKSYTIPLDNLAQIYKQTGENELCFSTLSKSQAQNPNDFCAFLLLGDYYRDMSDTDNALKNYREVIKINPNYNLAYLKIAKAKSDNLDFAGANATLKYYNSMNPKDDYALFLMARNFVYMNDFIKAKESIYKAISLSNCREYREELGKINYQNEEIEDALEAFTSTINQETSSEIYNYIGMCYYNLHDFKKSILNINKAISLPGSRVLYYYNLAQVYHTLKDELNYIKYMNLVKDFQPIKWQDYIDMSGILLDSESKNSAIEVLNQGITRYPKVKELYLEKLKIYDLTNDLQGKAQTKSDMENMFK